MRVTDFLSNNFSIVQDTELYRFTSDSILLSRFIKAKKGERVADFCAGSGVVGFNFYAENKNVDEVCFFEIQSELVSLCNETIALNGLQEKMTAHCLDIACLPKEFYERFSLVLCNPPYEKAGLSSPKEEIAPCKKELTLSLNDLLGSVKRALRFGGRAVICHRAERSAELISLLHENGLEPKKMQFVAGKRGKKPYLVLIAAVKGGSAGIEILPEGVNGEL